MGGDRKRVFRRELLASLGVTSVGGLAGCETADEPTETATSTESITATITSETATGESTTTSTTTRTSVPASIDIHDVTVPQESVAQLERFVVTIELRNSGGQTGTYDIELEIDQQATKSNTVTIDSEAVKPVEFQIALGTPGEHTLSVGNHSRRIAVAETVVSVDISDRGYWERLFFTCLQGIANRSRPQVYLRFQDADAKWAEWYQDEYDLRYHSITDPYRLVRELPVPVDGYVMVDIFEPDTANIGATFAAIEDLLPITERVLDEEAVPELPVKQDLRDRFHGMSKAETYRWGYDSQWPSANHGSVANLTTPRNLVERDISEYTADTDTIYLRFEDIIPSDGFGASVGGVAVLREGQSTHRIIPGTSGETEYLFDPDESWLNDNQQRIADKDQYWIYEIPEARNAETVRLDIQNEYHVRIATAADGPYTTIAKSETRGGGYYHNQIRDRVVADRGFFVELASDPGHPDERALKDRIFADMEPPGYVFGWVDRFPEGSERHHVQHASEHGRMVLGSYHGTPNFSVHRHIDTDVPQQPNSINPESVTVDEDAIYLSFKLSDGDSLWMHSTLHRGDWLSDERGQFPFGWGVQPLLKEVAPGLLDYYFKTATENDVFVASASGIGSQFPNHMSDSQLQAYLNRSKTYLEAFDFQLLWVRTDAVDGVSDAIARDYADTLGEQLVGVLERYWDRGGSERVIDGLAWIPTQLPDTNPDGHGIKQQTPTEMVSSLEQIAASISERPLFISIHIPVTQPNQLPPDERWGLTTASEIIDRLDTDTFEVIRPDEFAIAFSKARG